jgi:transcriptional regulator with XRE-family HTH domain
MPTASVTLTPNLASRLNRVRGLIGVSQETLATDAHVAQGTVSTLLSGKKPVRANYARTVVLAVQQAVEKHIESASPSEDEATELRRPVSEALAFVEGRNQERARLALPGGAIQPDAGNRVVRKAIEDLILRGLDSHQAAMRIDGSPQSGKSTLLRFAERGALRQGMNVTYFDDAALDAVVRDKRVEHFFGRLTQELAVSWGEATPTESPDANGLKQFVLRSRKRSARDKAIVIVDVPSDLPGLAQEELLETCRVLKNQSDLSWLIALQPPYERKTDWFKRSRGYFYPFVKLKAFSQSEVREFLESYPKAAEDTELLSWLKRLFGGQPFLTHVAIEMIDHGETRQSVERLALQRLDSFGVHLRRMEEALGPDLVSALRRPEADDRTDEEDREFLSELAIATFDVDSKGVIRRTWASKLYESCFGATGSLRI